MLIRQKKSLVQNYKILLQNISVTIVQQNETIKSYIEMEILKHVLCEGLLNIHTAHISILTNLLDSSRIDMNFLVYSNTLHHNNIQNSFSQVIMTSCLDNQSNDRNDTSSNYLHHFV